MGIESDNTFLHENFSYMIPYCGGSDPQCPIANADDGLAIFDYGTPTSFAFTGSRPDLEQAAYVQDAIQLGNWAIDAGLRWDHYQLLVNQNAVSPRLPWLAYFPPSGSRSTAPMTESSRRRPSKTSCCPVLRPRRLSIPAFPRCSCRSSLLTETTMSSAPQRHFFGKLRLDANLFRRDVNNYADDSQVLSTGISFPIAFRKAAVYGAEGQA